MGDAETLIPTHVASTKLLVRKNRFRFQLTDRDVAILKFIEDNTDVTVKSIKA